MRAAKVQASLRIRAVSPEPSLLAHTSSESRGTFRQKARSLAPLNGWTCAVEICHHGMLEDRLTGLKYGYNKTACATSRYKCKSNNLYGTDLCCCGAEEDSCKNIAIDYNEADF